MKYVALVITAAVVGAGAIAASTYLVPLVVGLIPGAKK